MPRPQHTFPAVFSLLHLARPSLGSAPSKGLPRCVPKVPAHSPALVAGTPAGRTNYPDLVLQAWNFSVFLIKIGSFLGMQGPKE